MKTFGIQDELMQRKEFNSKPKSKNSSVLEIGFGRNLKDSPLTREESLILLQNDMDRISRIATNLRYYADLTPTQRGVILILIYELGIESFKKMKDFNEALERRDFKKASAHLKKSDWAFTNKSWAFDLSKRIKVADNN